MENCYVYLKYPMKINIKIKKQYFQWFEFEMFSLEVEQKIISKVAN